MGEGRSQRWFLTALVIAVATPSFAYANIPVPVTGDVLVRDLLVALALTVIIEVAVAAAFRVGLKALAVVAAMDLVTNPMLNLVLLLAGRRILDGNVASLMVLVSEVVVLLVEWRVLLRVLEPAGWTPRRVLWLSLAINAASLFGGTWLATALFSWHPLWL